MTRINNKFAPGIIFDGHYKLIKSLSTAGGSSDVWLAIDINTIDETSDESKATKVAIKIYRPKNMIDIEGEYQFRKEFKKVFSCHHENIIQPTYFSIYEEMPYLVLPYCPSGSSEKLIGQLKSDKDLWKYIFEVASGMAYLHEHTPQIIHQDIKPANVLIDDNGNYAITDFGISAEMGGQDLDTEDEAGGTFAYMAPERFIEGAQPMKESDIWAFGATLYELITGDAPFGNDGGSKQQKDKNLPSIKQNIPDSIKQLIQECLSFEPEERPTARSIVDTVLKKRYSKNKKPLTIIFLTIILLAISITFYLTSRHNLNQDLYFNSLISSGDSLVNIELKAMESPNHKPSIDNISGLEKAIVLFSKVNKDASDSFEKKDSILNKVETINELIKEIREFDRAQDLAMKAELTEMEEEYMEFSLLSENHRIVINKIIQKLK